MCVYSPGTRASDSLAREHIGNGAKYVSISETAQKGGSRVLDLIRVLDAHTHVRILARHMRK
jgi:hypothetical protein